MRIFFKIIWKILTFPFRGIYWLVRRILRGIKRIFSDIRDFFLEEVEDAPLGDAFEKAIDHPQELLVHINALRRHLFRAVLAVVITTALSFLFFQDILEIVSAPLEGGMESLVAIDVTEPISTVMRVALLAGVVMAFPYITLEIWLFIAPGLSRKSRIGGLFTIPIASLLFFGGMIFSYYILLPAAIPFLINFMGIETIPRPSSYVQFVTTIMFWIGVAFEYPLVIFFLAKIGIVNWHVLLQQWRLAIVIIAVAAALITPTVDPVNMSLVMVPLIVLYFLGILLARIARPRPV
jgi:sec-independent protein translocase protein TatC